jgi:hypothetical protein
MYAPRGQGCAVADHQALQRWLAAPVAACPRFQLQLSSKDPPPPALPIQRTMHPPLRLSLMTRLVCCLRLCCCCFQHCCLYGGRAAACSESKDMGPPWPSAHCACPLGCWARGLTPQNQLAPIQLRSLVHPLQCPGLAPAPVHLPQMPAAAMQPPRCLAAYPVCLPE